MIWEDVYLDRVKFEAELELACQTKCIVDRVALGPVLNISEYWLPDYVFNIKAVYWMGRRLTPIPFIALSEIGTEIDGVIYGGFGAAGGPPREYFYNGFGENKIKLNPAANETLPYTDIGIWSSAIPNSLIIEFYRFPDGINFMVPDYIRRRTLKAYVCWKAFEKEGDGQNLKAAAYFKNKYIALQRRAKIIIDNIYKVNIPVRPLNTGIIYRNGPPRPVLPPNWNTITVYED